MKILIKTVTPHSASRPAPISDMKVEPHQPEPIGRTLQEGEQLLRSLFEFAPDAIAVLDRGGQIMHVNTQVERMFGYLREELVGQPVEMLMPERYRDRHTKHRAAYMAEPRTRPMGVGLELYGRRKDGTEFALDIMLSPMQASEAGIVIAVMRDITERKRAEQQIKESLKREALLRREIHHRVKNNLQVISSLLFLQSTHVTDPNTREILRESQGRARAIALIHEKLYQSTDLTKIAFCDYVRQLLGDLFHAYGVSSEVVSLKIGAEGIFLGIDAAIPCGLILNELVTNALKHGLPAGRKGAICIDIQPSGPGLLTLSVRDDGVGLPEDFDLQTSRTLGLKLVSDLTRQLGGTLELERNNGTAIKITFPEPTYTEPSCSYV